MFQQIDHIAADFFVKWDQILLLQFNQILGLNISIYISLIFYSLEISCVSHFVIFIICIRIECMSFLQNLLIISNILVFILLGYFVNVLMVFGQGEEIFAQNFIWQKQQNFNNEFVIWLRLDGKVTFDDHHVETIVLIFLFNFFIVDFEFLDLKDINVFYILSFGSLFFKLVIIRFKVIRWQLIIFCL